MSTLPKKLIAFSGKTSGRDKFCRLLQYSFRGLSDLLDRLDSVEYAPFVKKFKRLDGSISTARKLLRLGKSFEMLYAAKDAMYIKDFILQTCLTLARISSACFLFLDHILWLHRVKAIHIDIKPISKICNQFWLLSMVINLMRNAYDWHRIYQHHNQQRMRTTEVYVPETLPTLMDTVRNTFDILVPMNGLQYAHVPGVVQGATGVVSSLISIMVIWNDKYKLPNK